MKTILAFFVFAVMSASSFSQDIPAAPDNKAVVYFVRASQLGFAINFSYFDSTQLIAKFNGQGYARYECDPGRHVFWARSENRSFIEANLEAGKIYFVEAIPSMGAIKASVELRPADPATDQKRIAKYLKVISKRTPEQLSAEDLAIESKRMEDVVRRGWEKYQADKADNASFPQLTATMNYEAKPAE